MNFTAAQIRAYVEDRFRGQRMSSTREAKLKCPFHDDRTPSLTFNLERGVWHCFAGCGGGGVIEFELKLNGGDRNDAYERAAKIMGITENLFDPNRPKLVATYPYFDAEGRPVFHVLRYLPKEFKVRRPLGDGRYAYNLDGVKRPLPLYNFPDVLTANEIFIPEGEKDCGEILNAFKDKLKTGSIRIAATTCQGGVKKWADEYGVYFAGKRVVIFPDNDQAGIEHAERVARNIAKYAVGVKVVMLPGLPEKGDVSDWLADGHTADDLIAEIKKTPTWGVKELAQPSHVMLAEGAQFAAAAPPAVEWLVDSVIQKGGNGIVIGEPKAAKSLAMLDLLLALTTGTEWLGFNVPRRVKCALISREDYPGMTQQRIARLFRGSIRRTDFEGWLWVNTRFQTPTFLLSDDGQVSQLIAELRMEQIEFACFDVFRKLHGEDENDNQKMAKILDQLTRIQNEVGCAIALIHHTSKDLNGTIFRRIRGATAIHGWTEWAFGISVTNPDASPRDWKRKIEFETKAACPAEAKYFEIVGQDDALQLQQCPAPEKARPQPLKTSLSYMRGNDA